MQNQSNSQNELYTEEAKYADNGVIRENFHATKLQFILFARTYQPVYQLLQIPSLFSLPKFSMIFRYGNIDGFLIVNLLLCFPFFSVCTTCSSLIMACISQKL